MEKMNSDQALEALTKKGVMVLDAVPAGWKELKGALTAPKGYVWYWNGKSLFGGEYKDALVKEDRK